MKHRRKAAALLALAACSAPKAAPVDVTEGTTTTATTVATAPPSQDVGGESAIREEAAGTPPPGFNSPPTTIVINSVASGPLVVNLGDTPPEYVKQCESHGDYTAVNPSSGAGGAWQIIPSTWAGYGGYQRAEDAPPDVQDAKAAELWAGGRGAAHWSACL